MRVRCVTKDSEFAFLKVEEIISALRNASIVQSDGVEFVPLEEAVSPKLSCAELTDNGKEVIINITVCLRVRFPSDASYWSRLKLIYQKFETLAVFASPYGEDKRVHIFLEEAKLETQKDEPERYRILRK